MKHTVRFIRMVLLTTVAILALFPSILASLGVHMPSGEGAFIDGSKLSIANFPLYSSFSQWIEGVPPDADGSAWRVVGRELSDGKTLYTIGILALLAMLVRGRIHSQFVQPFRAAIRDSKDTLSTRVRILLHGTLTFADDVMTVGIAGFIHFILYDGMLLSAVVHLPQTPRRQEIAFYAVQTLVTFLLLIAVAYRTRKKYPTNALYRRLPFLLFGAVLRLVAFIGYATVISLLWASNAAMSAVLFVLGLAGVGAVANLRAR